MHPPLPPVRTRFKDRRQPVIIDNHLKPIILGDENGRLAALQRLDILDSPKEAPFEHIVSLVRSVLNVPIVAVSLIDKDRQWFKAITGLSVTETPRNISFCTYSIEQAEPFIVSDAEQDPRFAGNPLVTGEPGIRSYAGVQLRTVEGYVVGSLCAIDQTPRAFSAHEVDILSNFARIVERELELRQIAECDSLTGALTRRAFFQKANEEIERFHRYGRPTSLVLADLDHFKRVNDSYGHVAGDVVLCAATKLVVKTIRPIDSLGRLGGEEFAVLLPETEASSALDAADRFRQLLAQTDMDLPGGVAIRITASFGISQMSASISSVEQWIASADLALYAAKQAGRNQCRSAA